MQSLSRALFPLHGMQVIVAKPGGPGHPLRPEEQHSILGTSSAEFEGGCIYTLVFWRALVGLRQQQQTFPSLASTYYQDQKHM